MTSLTPTQPARLPGPASTAATTLHAVFETTKPGIVRLVTITSLVGFALAASARAWDTQALLFAGVLSTLGTALSAAGANAINQWMERDRDALMTRTQKRPLPTRRVVPGAVLIAGLALSALGVGVLLCLPTWLPAALSLTCVLSYTLAYTPLKLLTPWATYVGTIPGALPPLIGWTAASNSLADGLHPAGLSLVALMVAWQMPHSLALAWMYKDDYAKGGYRLLPVVTASGPHTAWHSMVWAIVLIPAALAPAYFFRDRLGLVYASLALLTCLPFVHAAWRFLMLQDRPSARRLFFVSIIQLPILLIAMVAEAVLRAVAQ